RPSPHGWVYGVPRPAYPPGQTHEPELPATLPPHHGGAPPFAGSRRRRAFHAEKKFPETCRFPAPWFVVPSEGHAPRVPTGDRNEGDGDREGQRRLRSRPHAQRTGIVRNGRLQRTTGGRRHHAGR